MESIAVLTSHALVALVVTAAWAPLLINILYNVDIVARHRLMRNKMNAEFVKHHAHKSGTPNMGGLMISITVAILTILFIPASDLRDVFLVGWGLFTLYGFVEGVMVSAKKVDDKFRLFQETFGWRLGKLLVLFMITLMMVLMFNSQLGVEQITISQDLSISYTFITAVIAAFAMVLAIYGVELTDGLDGLVTGKFIITLGAYAVIAVATGMTDLLPFIGLILGSSIIYLYFNITPARVFMGGTGTLPIAFALVLFATLTDTIPVFVIMGVVFWIELLSSLIQILSIRFRGKKVFRIAPIHHHFEAIGWSEAKVVQRFWLATGLATLVALWVFSTMR